MLGDWDLQSTLLRRAVQGGARHISVRGEPADEQLIVAERREDLEELQRRIFEGAGAVRRDWVSTHLLAPVERAATRALLPRTVTPAMLQLGATALTAIAALALAWHWLALGMALLILATPLDGIGARLAALRMQEEASASWWDHLLPILAAGALLALAFTLAPIRGWGCIALAGSAIAFLVALGVEAEGRDVPGRVWLSERKGMTWLLLPFAAAGLWGTGLTVLLLYAAGSFFWAQRYAHAAVPAASED
jgi:hypothetical protein